MKYRTLITQDNQNIYWYYKKLKEFYIVHVIEDFHFDWRIRIKEWAIKSVRNNVTDKFQYNIIKKALWDNKFINPLEKEKNIRDFIKKNHTFYTINAKKNKKYDTSIGVILRNEESGIRIREIQSHGIYKKTPKFIHKEYIISISRWGEYLDTLYAYCKKLSQKNIDTFFSSNTGTYFEF